MTSKIRGKQIHHREIVNEAPICQTQGITGRRVRIAAMLIAISALQVVHDVHDCGLRSATAIEEYKAVETSLQESLCAGA